jgi:hypothetical protein
LLGCDPGFVWGLRGPREKKEAWNEVPNQGFSFHEKRNRNLALYALIQVTVVLKPAAIKRKHVEAYLVVRCIVIG